MGFHITYDKGYGNYIVHSKELQFNKGEMGLPYIDAKKPQDVDFIQIVQDDFEGFIRK